MAAGGKAAATRGSSPTMLMVLLMALLLFATPTQARLSMALADPTLPVDVAAGAAAVSTAAAVDAAPQASDAAIPAAAAAEESATIAVADSAVAEPSVAAAMQPVAEVTEGLLQGEEPQQEAGAITAAATTTTTTLDLTASSALGGKTPAVIGVNLGHRYPGSNWPLWMQRLGVNGARVFLTSLWGSSLYSFSASSTTSKWGKSLSGTSVTDLATFQAAVAELRTPAGHDPTATGSWAYPVRFDKFDTRFVTTDTTTKADEQEGNHNATLAALKAMTQLNTPLVVIGCGQGSVKDGGILDTTNPAYWASHWEVYKHFYSFSLYLWRRSITRIELYNEPDLDNDFQPTSTTFNKPLWADVIAVRSRAIQDLYSDMNAQDSSQPDLTPDIHVGAYAKTTYDDVTLGKPGVQAQHVCYGGANPDPAWYNFKTYSYHSYGQSGKTILSNFNELYNASAADRAAQGQFPFSVTEFNAKTSGDFSTSTSNMDTPSQAVKLGSQAINYATAGSNLTSLYVFKFSVTLSNSNGVTKNGIHWGDNTGAPYNIAETTLGAEALRLVAEKLAGAQDIRVMTSAAAATLVDTKSIAVKDSSAYYVYVVNTGTASITASLTLSGWGIGASRPVIVNKVAANSYGEVDSILSTSGTDGTVSVPVGVDTLVRLTIPAAAVTVKDTVASAAGHVRAGTNSGTSYGTLTTMCVGSSSATHTNTYASAMRFTVSSPSTITAAVLKLTLSSLSASLTEPMTMLLLAMSNNAFTASTLTWTSMVSGPGALLTHPPAGSASTWTLNSTARNFINYNSPGLQIMGHVTLPVLTTSQAAGVVKQVDVSSYVKASNGNVAFILVRPFRRDKESPKDATYAVPADTLNGGTSACFHSLASTTTTARPRLLVY